MSRYKTLIFDLDDTLIDNNASVEYAFKQIISILNIQYSETLYEKWLKFDKDYWLAYEANRIKLPEDFSKFGDKINFLRSQRFKIFFHKLNLTFEQASKINKIYCDLLGINIISVETAIETLKDLYSSYEICIATNGPKDAALNKLDKADLRKFISTIVSSEEVDFSKPTKEFFEYLFNKIINKNKEQMLMIGDSLSTDVLGGMNNGIDTCWYNPSNMPLPDNYSPTITINKLSQLKKHL